MLVLPPARAGIGSAVNDATRELGSTLGVAIVGSLFSSAFGAHLADSAFAATGKSDAAAGSVQIAFGIAANNPQLLAAAAAGIVALPGRRFQPPFSMTSAALSSR